MVEPETMREPSPEARRVQPFSPMVRVAPDVLPLAVFAQAQRAAAPVAPRPSGFAVVLVLGDLNGTTGNEGTVPPAARKALADMKDFLPYKSYQLLDTQWTIGAGEVRSRLRGLEGQEYELDLDVQRKYEPGPVGSPTRAVEMVTFRLREVGTSAGGAAGTTTRSAVSIERAERNLQAARQEEELKQRLTRLRALQAEGGMAREVREDVVQEIQVMERQLRDSGRSSTRPLLDTSFPMQVGETVVVGTSRLQGDKALIVVLTAAAR